MPIINLGTPSLLQLAQIIPLSIAMSPAPLVELRDIELYYFPICGRGEPIRLILEDTGVKYTEVNDIAAFREKQSDVNEFRFNQIPRFKVRSRSSKFNIQRSTLVQPERFRLDLLMRICYESKRSWP